MGRLLAIRRFVSGRPTFLALAGLVVGVTVANLIWVSLEARPPHWDMGRHLWTSLYYADRLEHLRIPQMLLSYQYYPPFTYWVSSVFYLVTGSRELWVAILSNSVFLGVLAGSVYGLGAYLWDKRVGLLAAGVTLATPMLVTQFKEFQIDAPLTAMATLFLYLLVTGKEFEDRRHGLALGVCFGLGMLTKWTFPLVVALPLFLAMGAAALAAWRERSWHRMGTIGMAALAAYVAAGFWYLANYAQLLIDLRQNGVAVAVREGDPTGLTVEAFTWYARVLLSYQFHAVLLVLVVAGAAFCLSKVRQVPRSAYLYAMVAGVYLAMSAVANKDARYTLPLVPAAVLLGVAWTAYLPKRVRLGAELAIALVAAVTFLAISFGNAWLPKRAVTLKDGKEYIWFAQAGYLVGPPSDERWYQDEAFRLIAGRAGGHAVRVDMLDTIWFNGWGNEYYARKYGLSLVKVGDADYVLSRQAVEVGPPPGFVKLERWVLPDGTVAQVFGRP